MIREDNRVRSSKGAQELEVGDDGKLKPPPGAGDVMMNDVDGQALHLHTVQTLSQSFLQIVIQLYFLVLLVIMPGATIIAGRDAEDFFGDVCKCLLLNA